MKVSHLAVAAVLAMAAPVAGLAQTPPTAVAAAPTPADAALARIVADYEAYLKSIDPMSASGEGDVEEYQAAQESAA
jgi:hypothetical protein